MCRVPSPVRWSPRVYYIAGLAIALGVLAGAARGQEVALEVVPSMVRGPLKAPVTIVEFSDYQ